MDETKCPQCAGPLVQTRVGRQKRFCSDKCRVAYHQGRARTVAPFRRKAPAEAGPHTRAGLIATLSWLRDELERDIRARGVMVDGKPHPALELVRKITGDLARMSPAEVEEEAAPATLLELVIDDPPLVR